MSHVQRSIFGFLGTLVGLAWALHEVVYFHELARDGGTDDPRNPGTPPPR
jgi:hypothetical protein